MRDFLDIFQKIDFFQDARNEDYFIGRPFALDYDKARVLVADEWKWTVGGIPQGTFLLAFYENEKLVSEALLLRALKPTSLPTENSIISSMIEYYKDDLQTAGENSDLDSFTKYEFSFSGLECSILGTFYKDESDNLVFGADVENFFSPHNYNVYKPTGDVLKLIVNLRENETLLDRENDVKIGNVRYSSSMRYQGQNKKDIPVFINPQDFLGKRTALFGMTRTGKSNTVKKIIQTTLEISNKSKNDLKNRNMRLEDNLDPFEVNGAPKYPVGQIIFDVNGEYANANLQDEGTAIFELYNEKTVRYSVIAKNDFEKMLINFYTDVSAGFELVRAHLASDNVTYTSSFKEVDLTEPDPEGGYSSKNRHGRRIAAYLCCLYRAGFKPPKGFRVKFEGNQKINGAVASDKIINPKEGISLEDATNWFTWVWDNYDKNEFFSDYRKSNGHEWADEDLKALLIFLTRKSRSGGAADRAGYRKLRGSILRQHTPDKTESFENTILSSLKQGKIVIIDLSQGDPEIQTIFSDRLCKRIFQESMDNFVENRPNNFIQFYFEEAHTLFPKKEESDLNLIYNRIAKEGAKLNLGLIYATQEVSSISSNILKNTQNWFISHLNNRDELKEIKKYYDFADFVENLIRFSPNTDKGFVRMKTYSNPFVVPVQIEPFRKGV